MDYRTFNEWSISGYKILKGSKATWFPNSSGNVAKFSEKQVVKKQPRQYSGDYSQDYPDWDDPWEEVARDAAWGSD